MSFTIQSTPSRSPSPDLALQPIAPQCRVFTVSSSKKSLICSGVRLFGMSCLLQNTRSVAPMSFYCLSRACSSAFVSSSLSLSELSTTQMTPSVCSKQFLQQDLMVFCPPTSQTFSLKFSYCMDLMLKPRVGEIQLMSSPLNFLMMVVLPALSSPSTSNLIYFSFSLAFFTIDMNPISPEYNISNCAWVQMLQKVSDNILQLFLLTNSIHFYAAILGSIIYKSITRFQIMNQTPLAQIKFATNDSGILNQMHAYSPNLTSPKEQPPRPQNNQADSIEKILSSSIQRAKQKITMLEGKQRQERQENKERASSKEGHSNAIAAAMKVLQSRVNQLEQTVENHERERTIMLKELDNLANQKKLILNNLEESNRKITLLEHTQRNNKGQLKELSRQLEESQLQRNQLQSRCKSLEMSVRHLQTDKQQIAAQLARKQQQFAMKMPPNPKSSSRSADTDEKERVMEKDRKLHEKEKRLIQFESSLRQRQTRWNAEKSHMKQISLENENLQREVISLKQQLQEQGAKECQQKQNYQVYLSKIKQMQGELYMLRQTTKNLESHENTHPDQEELQLLRDDLTMFQNKYEELLRLFKRTEDKSKREEKELKVQKDRTRELEDLVAQMVEKVGKLPTSTKELKYLAVKAGKIISSSIQRCTTLKTPTKSRSNSLNRSLSRSNSQRKTTQNSQLNNSRHSNKGPQSGSKSKKKEQSGSKSKRVVLSQTGWESVEKEVADLKKQYKRLVKILNETEDEQTRNRLNEIAFAIQQKNERSTKMKQNSRHK